MEKAAAVAEVKELEEQLEATQAELAVAKRNVTKAAANSPSSGLIAELEASQVLQVHQLRPFMEYSQPPACVESMSCRDACP